MKEKPKNTPRLEPRDRNVAKTARTADNKARRIARAQRQHQRKRAKLILRMFAGKPVRESFRRNLSFRRNP